PAPADRRAAPVQFWGLTAYACHPLLDAGGEVIGTLSFGTRGRESFSEDELGLMKTVADLVAIALARRRAAGELRQKAEELARSNQDLERFAYVSSHDLQEPLRMVTGFLTLLQERCGERLDDKGREFIRQAVVGTARMRQLIDDLLEYSRAGQGAAAANPVAAREALGDALANLDAMILRSGAVVTAGELPTVRMERAQLAAIFQNLIANGIKYRRGDAPPRLRVEARSEHDQWAFSVRDNGIGIPAEQFERIFVIFQRLQSREHSAGTGIGLAIVKRIVETNGGRVWLESRVGEGSTFFFSLPA
ncbi:MAG TPA: ATP-binding protein, partial [Candidatus Methanoperedens sp.]|nr:ATP-binding protein [Candidatus Methanoperedens sp.]